LTAADDFFSAGTKTFSYVCCFQRATELSQFPLDRGIAGSASPKNVLLEWYAVVLLLINEFFIVNNNNTHYVALFVKLQ